MARPSRRIGRAFRGTWPLSFLIATAIGALWMVATPLFGVPDEPAHIVRAVSVARGQVLGDEPSETEFGAASPYVRQIIRTVEVPAILDLDESTSYEPPCFAFDPSQDAGCLVFGTDTGLVASVPTTAGTHPPAWYVIVGIPSRFTVDTVGIFAMRFVNVLLSAVFIAIAATAVSWSRSPSAGIGIAFAATPMLFFLTGGVNSSGPEIAAAIALWAGLGVLLQSAEPPRNLVWMSGLAAVSLVAIRRTGVVWVLLIVAIVLVAFGSRERLSALIRRPVVWAWAGATGVAFGCQLAWLSAVGSLSRGGDNATSPSVASTAAMTFADAYDTIVVQMVGNFGWLDTPVPAVVVVMWLLGLGTLAAAAVARRQIRALTAAAATLLATLLTFVAFEVIEAGSRPGFWQGRYSLPLAVGIPIVLGLSNSHSSRSDDVLRVNRPLAAVFVGAQAIAYFVYLERYSVGRGGGFSLFWDSDWSPPIPALALMVGYTVSVGVFGAMAVDSFRWRVTPKDGLTRSSRHREISKDQ